MTKTAPAVIWFDGSELDCNIAILMCLSMIEKAEKEIEKNKKKNCKCSAYQLEKYGCKCK